MQFPHNVETLALLDVPGVGNEGLGLSDSASHVSQNLFTPPPNLSIHNEVSTYRFEKALKRFSEKSNSDEMNDRYILLNSI